jgi:hypothetical protein
MQAWREDDSCEEGKLNCFCSHRKKFKVEVMDPMIEKYPMLYAQDLAQRVGLNENHLPNALTFSVFLNPLFSFEQRIVGSGLLTAAQYARARRGMSDLLEVFVITS